jgi:hypothetical protein
VLLPLGMEDALDANEGDEHSGTETRLGGRGSGGGGVPPRGFSPWDYRKAFGAADVVGESLAPRPLGSQVLKGGAFLADSGGGDRGGGTTRPATASGPLGTVDGGDATRRAPAPPLAGVNPAAKPFIAAASRVALTAASSSNPSPTLSQRPLTSQASYQSSPSSMPVESNDASVHGPAHPTSQQQSQPPLRPAGAVGRGPQPPPPPLPQRGGLQGPLGSGFGRPPNAVMAPQQQWAYPHVPAARPAPYLLSGSAQLSSLGFFESGPDVARADGGLVEAAEGSGPVEKQLPSELELVGGGESGGSQRGLLQPPGRRNASMFGLTGDGSFGAGLDGSLERSAEGLPFMMMGHNGQASKQNIWG